jgi:hypothetical protein
MRDDGDQREFRALSVPFDFITDRLFNKLGLFLLYLCSCITTYLLLIERDLQWWLYIGASILWMIPCGLGLFAMSISSGMADLFAEFIVEKFVQDARPNNVLHRCIHALLAIAIFIVIFGMIMLGWFGYIDDGCDGRYPRC